MNHPMQGSAADIIKLAMTEVQRRIMERGFEAKLLLQVHDELDFSVPEGEIEELSAIVKDVMEHIVELRASPLTSTSPTPITGRRRTEAPSALSPTLGAASVAPILLDL